MPENQEKKDDLRSDLKEFGRFMLLIAIIGGIVLGIVVGVTVFATQQSELSNYYSSYDIM